jgi:hypothetical protein
MRCETIKICLFLSLQQANFKMVVASSSLTSSVLYWFAWQFFLINERYLKPWMMSWWDFIEEVLAYTYCFQSFPYFFLH